MKTSISLPRPLAAAVVAAACAAGAPALAADLGLRVATDPETGQLRAPTAEENAALDAAAASQRKAAGRTAQRAAAPVPTLLANGTMMVELGEDSMMYSVARVNAQGKLERACVQGGEARDQALKAPASFAAPVQASKRVQVASRTVKAAKESLDEK